MEEQIETPEKKEQIKTPEKKRRGRPKTKQGKNITFYLSYPCIEKIKQMTMISRNASVLVENLVNKEYNQKPI